MTEFNYEKIINEIKNILKEDYLFHSLEMTMFEKGYVDHVNFLINTNFENLDNINPVIIDDIQQFINQFDYNINIGLLSLPPVTDYDKFSKDELENVRSYDIIVNLKEEELTDLEHHILNNNPDVIIIDNIEYLQNRYMEEYFE